MGEGLFKIGLRGYVRYTGAKIKKEFSKVPPRKLRAWLKSQANKNKLEDFFLWDAAVVAAKTYLGAPYSLFALRPLQTTKLRPETCK